jgi:inhibitor of KinA
MPRTPPKIVPLGESAVVVEFGTEISDELNAIAIGLSESLSRDPFPGFIEAVPAYASTTIFYDLAKVEVGCRGPASAFESVRSIVMNAVSNDRVEGTAECTIIEIPTDFSLAAGSILNMFPHHSDYRRTT